MHVHIIYTHPSEKSFAAQVRDEFIRGLIQASHSYSLSDLYAMDFKSDLSEYEYEQTCGLKLPELTQDVIDEQNKINFSDALVFIYPVYWTEAPAKLVGWFDRVWSQGFAYNTELSNNPMKVLKKALFICTAGATQELLIQQERYQSMKVIMLNDRIYNRAIEKDFVLLGGMSWSDLEQREKNKKINLKKAYELGLNF